MSILLCINRTIEKGKMMQSSDPFAAINIIFLVIVFCCACLDSGRKDEKSERARKSRERGEVYASSRRRSTGYWKARSASRRIRRPIPGVSSSLSQKPRILEDSKVKALRGGEFIGNRMRFKVKVVNDSEYMITDVRVYLLSFPKTSLRLASDDDCQFSKIEPGGFRSPTFDFVPTQDCVRGNVVAGISYMDMHGNPHTLSTKPFVIKSVCDLLLPDQVSPEDFELKLNEQEHGEIVIKVNEWTPKEMFDKAIRIVDESNFFEVDSNFEETDGIVYASISGLAKGKYTGKSVGVQINITGPSGVKGARCTLRVSGEDQAMILPAIDDLRERLSAWLCPMCGSALTLQNVEDLREGKVITCPFCSVPIGR